MPKIDPNRGPWANTSSGRPYYFLDPRPEEIHIEDVAMHLSRICRFGGALRPDVTGIYSVAQHSVLASYIAPPHLQLEALLHDGHEAYIQDCIQPIKSILDDYQELEEINETVFRKKFGLTKKLPKEVKDIDVRLFVTEGRALCNFNEEYLQSFPPGYDIEIRPVVQRRAYEDFMARFEELSPL